MLEVDRSCWFMLYFSVEVCGHSDTIMLVDCGLKKKQKNFHIKLILPSAIDPKMAAAAFKWLIAWWEGE